MEGTTYSFLPASFSGSLQQLFRRFLEHFQPLLLCFDWDLHAELSLVFAPLGFPSKSMMLERNTLFKPFLMRHVAKKQKEPPFHQHYIRFPKGKYVIKTMLFET